MGDTEIHSVRDRLRGALVNDGFDLFGFLRVGDYNDQFPDYPMPDLGNPDHGTLVVGNTRALWEKFTDAWARDRNLRASSDPLDDWVEGRLRGATESWELGHQRRFAHTPPPRSVAIQRLAELAGLGGVSRSGLNVHPVFGPWVSLRGACTVAVPVDPGRQAKPIETCGHCDTACGLSLTKALNGGSWRDWLALRDACPVGREYRFSEPQLGYHYTKDPRYLLCADSQWSLKSE